MKSLFISDLHLSPETMQIAQQLVMLLNTQAQDADEVYILGDMFEAWLGDDAMPEAIKPLISQLSALSKRGCRVFLMQGNRDFLMGEEFARLCGATLLPEAHVIQLQGQPTLLMHGDQLCTDDVGYQSFRQQVRNPQWQKQFLSLPIPNRMEMAKQARAASKEQTSHKAEYIMDVNQQTVIDTMRQHGVSQVIHGHTHRPATHTFELDGQPARRIVLGDWTDRPSYLVVNGDKMQLVDPRISS
ncbi:MAG: UDP-2,3-diacylglucosamine diphosphatase [Gammaproteobacteria bacterium]|nr:UDP-2,3-diacylglucosamine diphosphatase [Gammaproteobacteria bacterium]